MCSFHIAGKQKHISTAMTSIGSLKDKSAIVKIDTSALIKKLIALSVDSRELDFVDFESGRSRRQSRRDGQQSSIQIPSLGVSDLRSVLQS